MFKINDSFSYCGPRPHRDAPSWMDSPVAFRRLDGFGNAEVMTTSGSQHVPLIWLKRLPSPKPAHVHTGFECGAL